MRTFGRIFSYEKRKIHSQDDRYKHTHPSAAQHTLEIRAPPPLQNLEITRLLALEDLCQPNPTTGQSKFGYKELSRFSEKRSLFPPFIFFKGPKLSIKKLLPQSGHIKF